MERQNLRKSVKRMGLCVVAADGDAHAPGLAMADAAYVINILDADACVGCGLCEYVCVTEETSIRVIPQSAVANRG